MTLIRLLDKARTVVFGTLRLRTIGAVVLPVAEDGSVLLIKHTYGAGTWGLPGGGVRRYETVRAAALREAAEEVGLRLGDDGTLDLLGIYLRRRGGWSDQVCVFVARGWKVEPVRSREIASSGKFDPDALPADVAPSVRRRIDEWRGRRPVADVW